LICEGDNELAPWRSGAIVGLLVSSNNSYRDSRISFPRRVAVNNGIQCLYRIRALNGAHCNIGNPIACANRLSPYTHSNLPDLAPAVSTRNGASEIVASDSYDIQAGFNSKAVVPLAEVRAERIKRYSLYGGGTRSLGRDVYV